jgi:hypothetical protein
MSERKIIEDLLTVMRLAARRVSPLMRARLRKAILDAEAALVEGKGKSKKAADPLPE